jgi:mycothiol synthase
VTIAVRGEISSAEAAAVLQLADAAASADGVGPLSEQVRLQVRYGGDPALTNLLLWRDRDLAGFAHLGSADPAAGRSGELVIHPGHRRRGLGLTLARAVVAEGGPMPVRLWAHGDLPGAARLASRAGFTRARALWRMRRPLSGPLAEPALPEGVSLRRFVPGQDEEDWILLNARAFAGHPEQGRWVRADLERREGEPWFDTDGFFLAQRHGRLVGFHWTKIHPPAAGHQDGVVGEVYVLGVDPSEQGTGLGRALTLAGLQYLRSCGVPDVMLYVESVNAPAIKLYTSAGFTHTDTDVMYQHESPRRA